MRLRANMYKSHKFLARHEHMICSLHMGKNQSNPYAFSSRQQKGPCWCWVIYSSRWCVGVGVMYEYRYYLCRCGRVRTSCWSVVCV